MIFIYTSDNSRWSIRDIETKVKKWRTSISCGEDQKEIHGRICIAVENIITSIQSLIIAIVDCLLSL